MMMGPQPAKARRAPYLPPHKRRCAPIPDRTFPAGVRRTTNGWGASFHEYLQADGRWAPCGGRGRCRECISEELAKSVEQRVRESLAERLGVDRLLTIDAAQAFFGGLVDDDEGTRTETLTGLDYEFQIYLPESAVEGRVSVSSLVSAVAGALPTTGAVR